jgi:hypothetical protein
MITTHNLKEVVAGALLSGGVVVVGLGLASTVTLRHGSGGVAGKPITAFNLQPESPGQLTELSALALQNQSLLTQLAGPGCALGHGSMPLVSLLGESGWPR